MNKRTILLAILAFLLLPKLAWANPVVGFFTYGIGLFPVVFVVELLVFYFLALFHFRKARLRNSATGAVMDRPRLLFLRVLGATFFGNLFTTRLWHFPEKNLNRRAASKWVIERISHFCHSLNPCESCNSEFLS